MKSIVATVIRTARRREADDKPVNVSLLCADIGLSRQHVSRLFRAETGIFLKEYLRRRRLRMAARLLVRRPAMQLRDVGTACGYSSESHFRIQFSRWHGVPPGRFRREALRGRLDRTP